MHRQRATLKRISGGARNASLKTNLAFADSERLCGVGPPRGLDGAD